MTFSTENLKEIKRKSDRLFFCLGEGQFWVFKPKSIEVHDAEGKVQSFRKQSIQFASDGHTCVMHPDFVETTN